MPSVPREVRDAALKARKLANEHQREHRNTDPADAAVAKRGEDLERAAREASAELTTAETAMRADAAVKRREDRVAHETGLQSQLRADARARAEKRSESKD